MMHTFLKNTQYSSIMVSDSYQKARLLASLFQVEPSINLKL